MLNKNPGSIHYYITSGKPLKDKDGNEITLSFA